MKTTNGIICKDRGKVKGKERTQTKRKKDKSFYSKNVNPEQRQRIEQEQKKTTRVDNPSGGLAARRCELWNSFYLNKVLTNTFLFRVRTKVLVRHKSFAI